MIKSLINLKACKRLDINEIDTFVKRAENVVEFIDKKNSPSEIDVKNRASVNSFTKWLEEKGGGPTIKDVDKETAKNVSDLYTAALKQFNGIKDDILKRQMLQFLDILQKATVPIPEQNYLEKDLDQLTKSIIDIEKKVNLDILQDYVNTSRYTDAIVHHYEDRIKKIDTEIKDLIEEIKNTSKTTKDEYENTTYVAKLEEIFTDGLVIINFMKEFNN